MRIISIGAEDQTDVVSSVPTSAAPMSPGRSDTQPAVASAAAPRRADAPPEDVDTRWTPLPGSGAEKSGAAPVPSGPRPGPSSPPPAAKDEENRAAAPPAAGAPAPDAASGDAEKPATAAGAEEGSASQPRAEGTDVDVVDAVEEVEADAAKSAPSSRKSEVDAVEEIDPSEEIPVDMVSEAPKSLPKKPPPPPPPTKRTQTSPGTAPAVSGPISTPPPPASAPAAAPAASTSAPPSLGEKRKRQKPWWEDLFGDDFIRTLDKLEPKIVRREVDFIEDSLGVEKGAVILDLACGGGGHAVELASRGYSVVGYDLSLAMLARAADEAQDRGQKLNFLQGDMRDMAFEETFDGVYCWSTSFGYFDDEKNFNVLQRTHRALRQGGLLLLDIMNRDYVAPRQPSLVWFEGDGCVCIDEMHLDFFTSRLRVKRTAMFDDGRSREIDYSIRLYTLHEVGKLLHESGFKVVEVSGHPAHRGVFFGSESARIIVLAERG